jgi:hypothetical protein
MKPLVQQELFDREFGRAAVTMAGLTAWVANNGLQLPPTVPELTDFDVVHVETLLCAIERGVPNLQDDVALELARSVECSDSTREKINDGNANLARWLVSADVPLSWRKRLRAALDASELQAVDVLTGLPTQWVRPEPVALHPSRGLVKVTLSGRPTRAEIDRLKVPVNAKLDVMTCGGLGIRASYVDHEWLTDYVDDIAVRQAKGRFELNECAQILAEAKGLDARALHKRMKVAIFNGEFKIRDAATEVPRNKYDGYQATDFAFAADVDALLTSWGVSYRFPGLDTVASTPPPKAVNRQPSQEDAILLKLRELGFDPLAIARPPGKRIEAYWQVKASLRYTKDVMRKAWNRLREDKRLKTYKP